MAWVLSVDSVDIIHYVDIETVLVEEVATQELARVGVLRFTAHDHTATIAIEAEDAVVMTVDATTVYSGKVKELSEWTEGVTRYWRVTCADENVLLEETGIDSYTIDTYDDDDDEIAAIFAAFRADVDATTYVTQLDTTMPELILDGYTLREALDAICAHTGGRYYVDFDKALHYFASEGNSAAFSLSDSPNGSTSFGYEGFRPFISSTRIAKRFFILGQGVSGWIAGDSYVPGAPEGVNRDNRITTAAGWNKRGTQLLDRYEDEQVSYELYTRKDGLSAGMDVTLVNAPRSIDASFTIRRIVWTFEDKAGDRRLYHLWLNDEPADAAARTYTVQQRLNTVEQGLNEASETVFDTNPPSAPTFNAGNLSTGTVINNDGTELVYIITTWGSVGDSDLSHYEVQLSTASDFTANVLTRQHPGDGQRIERWEGLTGNVTYYARVRAVDWALNASAWVAANIASAVDSSAPAQVTGAVAAGARTLIGLTWAASSAADLAHYEVQRSPDGSTGWTTQATIRTTHWIDQSFSEAQVLAATTFYYRVRAVDTSGNPGTWSSTVNAALNPLGSDSIAANAIIAGKIAANAVTTDKLNAGAVTTAKLDAGAVTVAKLDVVVGGYNLLMNSGMNDDDDGDGVPDEWTLGGNINNYTSALDTNIKVVGASGWKLAVTAGDASGAYREIHQDVTLAGVPLAVGDDFAISGYIRANSLSNLRALLFVQWLDVGSGVLQTDYVATITSDQDFTRHTLTNTVPASALTARVWCYVDLTADNGTGIVYFDAIKLERGDVPTSWTTGMIGNVVIDSNRVQVQDADAKVWLGKRGASLGMWGEDAAGDLQVGWWASGANAGAVLAGAGNVIVDANGITINGSGKLNFPFSATNKTTMYQQNASRFYVSMDDADCEFHILEATNGYPGTVFNNLFSVQHDKTLNLYPIYVGPDVGPNTEMTYGLTISQGASDDEILALKSSDVAHGVTDETETDTYGSLKKVEGNSGGLLVRGLKDADGTNYSALNLQGLLAENADTTKTTAGRGIAEIWGLQTSGAAIANTVANGNVLTVGTYRGGAWVTVFIVDEDGDQYFDGSATPYDAYDDALMAGDLAHLMSGQYDKLIEHNRQAFEAAGIIGPQDERGRFMVSTKGITALTLGALGQLWQEKQGACTRLERLERALSRIDPRLLEEAVRV